MGSQQAMKQLVTTTTGQQDQRLLEQALPKMRSCRPVLVQPKLRALQPAETQERQKMPYPAAEELPH